MEHWAWEMRAGDPSDFAFGLTFLRNPHGDGDRATAEEHASWGAFRLWAGGENLCAHREQGEVLGAAHWYLLPLLEWLADNWDPLLHEEKLPLRNARGSAAESLASTRLPPVSLKETDEFAWLDTWAAWWDRHSIRSAAEGGLFPDVYVRRYRELLEISTGAEDLMGVPADFAFLSPHRVYRVDPVTVAETLFTVLKAATAELRRRLPDSSRLAELEDKVRGLESPGRNDSRLAWLAGLGDNTDRYAATAAVVNEALCGVPAAERDAITGPDLATPLVVVGSALARLLYGAASPQTTPADVLTLTREVVGNFVPDASQWLANLTLPLAVSEVAQLTPGEQGSRLGEQAAELLGTTRGQWMDIATVLERLGVQTSAIELSDPNIRAVSVFGPTQRPHVFCNKLTVWGTSDQVTRFTLAHELCHFLLDREHGDDLAIATGPWAPLEVEQRASAFAAAFLMPSWLLREALKASELPVQHSETIGRISTTLRVSASSLVDRLHNLGELTMDERLRLR